MSEHEQIALLVPWYVNGTLDAEERGAVERHVAHCDACRELVRQDRTMTRAAPSAPSPESMSHVHPALLTQYVEEPQQLDADTVAWIEGRLAACASCREALANLREVELSLGRAAAAGAEAAGVEERPSSLRAALEGLWHSLSASVLRPVPALAYLLLLVLALPTVWIVGRGKPGTTPAPFATPQVLALPGARATREGGVGTPAAAFEIDLPATGAPLLLELATELVPGDLGRDTSYRVELDRGGRLLWSDARRGDDFVDTGGKLTLPLVLYPQQLEVGTEYEIRIRVERPGDPLDGQALFRRTIVLRR